MACQITVTVEEGVTEVVGGSCQRVDGSGPVQPGDTITVGFTVRNTRNSGVNYAKVAVGPNGNVLESEGNNFLAAGTEVGTEMDFPAPSSIGSGQSITIRVGNVTEAEAPDPLSTQESGSQTAGDILGM